MVNGMARNCRSRNSHASWKMSAGTLMTFRMRPQNMQLNRVITTAVTPAIRTALLT